MEQEHDRHKSQYHTLFRQYDAVLGRWWSIDPEQERYASFSPYTAMGANPVNYVDPWGLSQTDPNKDWSEPEEGEDIYRMHEGSTFRWSEKFGKWLYAAYSGDKTRLALDASAREGGLINNTSISSYEGNFWTNYKNISNTFSKFPFLNTVGVGMDMAYGAADAISVTAQNLTYRIIQSDSDARHLDGSSADHYKDLQNSFVEVSSMILFSEFMQLRYFNAKTFFSGDLGFNSKLFGNKVSGTQGLLNDYEKYFKFGWSGGKHPFTGEGGYFLRIGIGHNPSNPKQAWKHIEIKSTFISNEKANPKILEMIENNR